MKTKNTKELTARFIEAMHEIIKNDKLSNGKIDTVKAFAESIGQSPQNVSMFSKKGRHVGTAIIIETCLKYRVNPTYLILGEGEMFLSNDLTGRVNDLEKRVRKLEKR